MTPTLKSYLLGGSVGVAVFGALELFPYSSWRVAAAAGTVIGAAAVALFRSMLDKDFLLGKQPDPEADDGSGERPVWGPRDMDRLSPHAAWANGNSILPHGDDTQEMPAPGSGDRTRVYNSGLFDLRVSRPEGRHRAGVRP